MRRILAVAIMCAGFAVPVARGAQGGSMIGGEGGGSTMSGVPAAGGGTFMMGDGTMQLRSGAPATEPMSEGEGRKVDAAQAAGAGTPDPDNGARMYFTGISRRDGPVMYTGGPEFGGMMMGMMNSRLTCASCHGPEGRGGIHAMHMYVMKAPDIRYGALNAMPEMRGRDHPYDFHDFREAVADGRHPDGEKLKRDMPRWQMSEADFRDLFACLKRLAR